MSWCSRQVCNDNLKHDVTALQLPYFPHVIVHTDLGPYFYDAKKQGSFSHGPTLTHKKLQSIQGTAAKVLTETKRSDHHIPVFNSLHWLPVGYRKGSCGLIFNQWMGWDQNRPGYIVYIELGFRPFQKHYISLESIEICSYLTYQAQTPSFKILYQILIKSSLLHILSQPNQYIICKYVVLRVEYDYV